MLKIDQIDVFYGDFHALWDVSLTISKGDIVSIIGANGAGKSTLMYAIAGQHVPANGTIEFMGDRIDGMGPHLSVGKGIALVPEGRRVFPRLTVYDNLIIGAYTPRARANIDENIKKIHDLFPILAERGNQRSITLSGGEQQMLAIGRALMSEPELLLCDEISLGLAPVVIKSIYKQLEVISQEGLTIVLVEQDVKRSLRFADYAYVMLEGKIALQGKAVELGEDQVKKAYFGM
ncbi:MAG: ABC transporter ATP-binding protein [Desulfobulbaceae bacterium]|nr:MAG: ABC transporter ATP-binding protein [Desulfobulbaceae bacterium]